jgi:hypothetical protein
MGSGRRFTLEQQQTEGNPIESTTCNRAGAVGGHRARIRRRTVVDPEPRRQLPEWLSRLGQLLRAIGRCAHTRDPAREAAQRSMPVGMARVRHSVLAQRALTGASLPASRQEAAHARHRRCFAHARSPRRGRQRSSALADHCARSAMRLVQQLKGRKTKRSGGGS